MINTLISFRTLIFFFEFLLFCGRTDHQEDGKNIIDPSTGMKYIIYHIACISRISATPNRSCVI